MKKLFFVAMAIVAAVLLVSCGKEKPENGSGDSNVRPSDIEGSWYVVEQTDHAYVSGSDISLRLAEIYTFKDGKMSLSMAPGIRPADYFKYEAKLIDYSVENGVYSNWESVEYDLADGMLTIKGKGSNGLDIYVKLSRTEPADWTQLVLDTKKFVGDITAFTWYISSVSADLLGTGKPTELPFAYTVEFNETVVLTLDPSTSLDTFREKYGNLEADYDIETGTFMNLSGVVYDSSNPGKLKINVRIPNGNSAMDASFNLVNGKPSDWNDKVSQFAGMAPYLVSVLDSIIAK